MDVVVASPDDVRPTLQALRALGYLWRGDLGIEGRQAFFQPDDDLPEAPPLRGRRGIEGHLDHVLLRDHLRSHPDDARATAT
jgi:hypothetical protein